MTYNMIKTQFFLYRTLHYSQIYNFILNHDYKFKIIIMFKDVWTSKSKKVYVFFECFEHMDPFLWNILKFTIFFEVIWQTFDKENKLLKPKKTHMSTYIFWVL
jgi:hypothetical protein